MGNGDSLQVVQGEIECKAARIVAGAKVALRPERRRYWGTFISLLLILVSLLVWGDQVPAWIVDPVLAVAAYYFFVISFGELRPRENWLGFGWRWFEWTKADVRNGLILILVFVLGLVIGH